MVEKYYLDTCVWRDFYENRVSRDGRLLGICAKKLIKKIIHDNDIILYSDLIEKELLKEYTEQELCDKLDALILLDILHKVHLNELTRIKSRTIKNKYKIPLADAAHAILAKENKALLVTQDKHLLKLKNILKVSKPDDLI